MDSIASSGWGLGLVILLLYGVLNRIEAMEKRVARICEKMGIADQEEK